MESLMIILLYLILECSGQDCQSKLGSCVITPDSSRACVGYKEKVSESTNYIGIMWDLTVDLELDAEEAECYCNSAFGTSLATILDEDDQNEMEQLLDIQYSLRRDGFWPGKTGRVWVGWSNDDVDNGNSAWKPCLPSQCANGDTCSANNAKSALWHSSLQGDDELFYRRRCGTMYLSTQADTGKWDAVTCYGKKDFVCNHPEGKYSTPMTCVEPTDQPTKQPTDNPTTNQPTGSPTTLDPTPQPTPVPVPPPTPIPPPTPCTSDLALDIGFLMDESSSITDSEFIPMKNFIKRLIEYDINSISYVSLFSYSSNYAFEQWEPFTLEKDETLARLDIRIQQKLSTHTGDGITKTLALFNAFNAQNSNTRPDLLFVLTDGVAKDQVCPALTAKVIDSGVEIILIGIGDGLDIDRLKGSMYECLYTDPDKDVFYFFDFDSDEFNKREAEIRERTCRNIVFPAGSSNLDELPKVNIDGYNYNMVYVVLISTLANIFIFFITYQLCIKPKFKKHAFYKVTSTDEEEALNS